MFYLDVEILTQKEMWSFCFSVINLKPSCRFSQTKNGSSRRNITSLQLVRSRSQESFSQENELLYTSPWLNAYWGPGELDVWGKALMVSRDWGHPSLVTAIPAPPVDQEERGREGRSSFQLLCLRIPSVAGDAQEVHMHPLRLAMYTTPVGTCHPSPSPPLCRGLQHCSHLWELGGRPAPPASRGVQRSCPVWCKKLCHTAPHPPQTGWGGSNIHCSLTFPQTRQSPLGGRGWGTWQLLLAYSCCPCNLAGWQRQDCKAWEAGIGLWEAIPKPNSLLPGFQCCPNTQLGGECNVLGARNKEWVLSPHPRS